MIECQITNKKIELFLALVIEELVIYSTLVIRNSTLPVVKNSKETEGSKCAA